MEHQPDNSEKKQSAPLLTFEDTGERISSEITVSRVTHLGLPQGSGIAPAECGGPLCGGPLIACGVGWTPSGSVSWWKSPDPLHTRVGPGSCGSSEPFLPPGCLRKFWGVFALSPTPPPPVPSVCCGLGGGSVFSIHCRLLAREFQQLRVQQRVSRVGTEVAPWDGSWRPSPALSVLPGPGPRLGEVISFPDCQFSIPSFPLKVTSHCHSPAGAGPAPSCPRPCPQEPGLRKPSHSLENGEGLQQ